MRSHSHTSVVIQVSPAPLTVSSRLQDDYFHNHYIIGATLTRSTLHALPVALWFVLYDNDEVMEFILAVPCLARPLFALSGETAACLDSCAGSTQVLVIVPADYLCIPRAPIYIHHRPQQLQCYLHSISFNCDIADGCCRCSLSYTNNNYNNIISRSLWTS
eukprot:680128-Amphidinium_carterae.3